MVLVETENHGSRSKLFLGGWRNTITGIVYYNACTQTERQHRSCQDTYSRITQTTDLLDKFTETQCDKAVQACLIPDVRDRFLVPRKFRDRDAENTDTSLEERLLESVVKIQRFYRSHRDRKTAIHLLDIPSNTKDKDEQQTSEVPTSYRSTDFVILNRRTPRTRQEFEFLRNLLDRWRTQETERASHSLFETSRIALCSLILSKEVELLRTLDSMKTALKLTKKERKYRKFLDELSRPILWRNSRGEPILVDTPRVHYARELRSTYHSLSKDALPTAERIDLLSKLRRTAKMHTCQRSRDLIYLIDQELDLLEHNVPENMLTWLRNRLKITFLRLARDSLKVDSEEDVRYYEGAVMSGKKLCKTCGRIWPLDKFSRSHSFSCSYCFYLRARKRPKILDESYERMLREIRRSEAKMGCYTSLAFVVDSKIICQLVNDLWHGKSPISGNDVIDELKLVRFRREVDWSPWNNLLLTRKEAAVHMAIDDHNEFYGSTMLREFHTTNLQAKAYFEPIFEIRKKH